MHTCCPVDEQRIVHAITKLAAGQAVVLVDDTNPAGEGSLVFAAEMAIPELMTFAVRRTFGYIRVALRGSECDRLKLPLMYPDRDGRSTDSHTVTVDAAQGSTGISATERAHTARLLADPRANAQDFTRPGHVVPIRADDGGVLSRPRTGEAAVDLARLAGLRPAAVLCELVSEILDGDVAHDGEPATFAAKYGLAIVTITELAAYRQRIERHVTRMAELQIPVQLSGFRAVVYGSTADDVERIAFIRGDLGDGQNILVYEHVEHLAMDVFGSARCVCLARLSAAMSDIVAADRGVVIYHRPYAGRGTDTPHELLAWASPDARPGPDAQPRPDAQCASLQSILIPGASAQILSDLGVRSVWMLVDDFAPACDLEGGPSVAGRLPLGLQGTGLPGESLRA